MNNIDQKLQDILSKNLETPESYDNMINITFENLKSKKKLKNNHFKLKLATACCSLLLITGVVFAKDIENWIKETFWPKGIQSAIDNGYVGNTENDFSNQIVKVIENNEIIDSINVNTKIGDFLMTDSTINVEFTFEFDEKINDYIDF